MGERMNIRREFAYFKIFDKNWDKLGLNDFDLAELEQMILENPDVGKIIPGTGGLRKMRFALPHRGKSGSARVLYVDFMFYERVVLMNVYGKNEQDTLTDKQKQEYKMLIDKYLKGMRENAKHP
jgi:hypothetical protein